MRMMSCDFDFGNKFAIYENKYLKIEDLEIIWMQ